MLNLSKNNSWKGSSSSFDLDLVVVVGFCVVSFDLVANQFSQDLSEELSSCLVNVSEFGLVSVECLFVSIRFDVVLLLFLVLGLAVWGVCRFEDDTVRSLSSTLPNVANSTETSVSCSSVFVAFWYFVLTFFVFEVLKASFLTFPGALLLPLRSCATPACFLAETDNCDNCGCFNVAPVVFSPRLEIETSRPFIKRVGTLPTVEIYISNLNKCSFQI